MTPVRQAVGLSLFSHVGRHAGGLSTIVGLARDRACSHAALLGCGPVEPFLVAHLMGQNGASTTEIACVDDNPEVIAALGTLVRGEPVELAALALLCRDDYQRDGDPNSNFGERLAAGFRDVLTATGESPFRSSRDLLWADPSGVALSIHSRDAVEFLRGTQDRSLDFVYMGLLLANIRKSAPSSVPAELLREVVRCSSNDAVIGIGASLSPDHGVHLDIRDALSAGMSLIYVSLESLTLSDDRLFGDYGIAATLATSPAPPISLDLSNLAWLRSTRVSTQDDLNGAFTPGADDRLVLGAVRGEQGWLVVSASESEIAAGLTPDERVIINSASWTHPSGR